MKGQSIGNLSVVVREVATGVQRLIWSRRGPQGDKWMTYSVGFDSAIDYQVCTLSELS